MHVVVIDALSVYLTGPSTPPGGGTSTDLSTSVNLYLESGGVKPPWIQVSLIYIYSHTSPQYIVFRLVYVYMPLLIFGSPHIYSFCSCFLSMCNYICHVMTICLGWDCY